MVVTTTSNVNNIIQQLKQFPMVPREAINNTIAFMTKKMVESMKYTIETNKDVWLERNTNIEKAESHIADFHVELSDRKSVIEIGSRTPKMIMADGTKVNPFYFIEFGFGPDAEMDSGDMEEQYNWKYNINGHEGYWYFKGLDGHTEKSCGRFGTHFLYRAIMYCRDSIKYFMAEHLEAALFFSNIECLKVN